MNIKCKYCLFNIMIWVLIISGLFVAWVDWFEFLPSKTGRTIVAIFIVLPIGALLQHLMLGILGWDVVIKAEDKSLSVPYQYSSSYGTLERCLYLTLLLFNKPEAILLWLGFKAITKWGQGEYNNKWTKSKAYNLSLIGEFINIFLSFIGILIIKGNLQALVCDFASKGN